MFSVNLEVAEANMTTSESMTTNQTARYGLLFLNIIFFVVGFFGECHLFILRANCIAF